MSNIKLFESKKIRSAWNETDQKWYFSVADVVEALTDTVNARDYIKKMRKRDPALNSNWGTICPLVEMTAADGKRRPVQCANVEGLLRIIVLPSDNLRDHMTDLELIFTMLGEASTTEIARNKNARGFNENKKASREGGKIAGDARKALEKKSGRKVVSKQNYKALPEREVRRLHAGNEES